MDFNTILRDTWQTSLVFLALFAFTRFLGKTQIGQLTFYEYISGITIGSIAGNIAAAEPDKYFSHFYDLFIFITLTYIFSYLTLTNRTLRKLIQGEASVLIENGLILKDSMKKIRFDLDELTAQLRQQGILDIREVQFAILETSGNLSVIKKFDQQAASRADIGIQNTLVSYPIELIMDGTIIEENMKKHNISETWLQSELRLQGCTSPQEVLYCVIDSQGKLFVSPIVHTPRA